MNFDEVYVSADRMDIMLQAATPLPDGRFALPGGQIITASGNISSMDDHREGGIPYRNAMKNLQQLTFDIRSAFPRAIVGRADLTGEKTLSSPIAVPVQDSFAKLVAFEFGVGNVHVNPVSNPDRLRSMLAVQRNEMQQPLSAQRKFRRKFRKRLIGRPKLVENDHSSADLALQVQDLDEEEHVDLGQGRIVQARGMDELDYETALRDEVYRVCHQPVEVCLRERKATLVGVLSPYVSLIEQHLRHRRAQNVVVLPHQLKHYPSHPISAIPSRVAG